MKIEHEDIDRRLRLAFQDGAQFCRACTVYVPGGGPMTQQRQYEFVGHNVEIGAIRLPTGRIVAADVNSMLDLRAPFVRSVPAGEYPVTITVATDAKAERRVAFARITFLSGEVSWWDGGETFESRKRELPIEQCEGYGVDSGTGGFLDAATAEYLLRSRQNRDPEAYSICMSENQLAPRLAAFASLPPPFERTLAVFSSGLGDGVYDSYWGMSDAGRPVCLLTDFNLAGNPTMRPRAPHTLWRRIRHWAIRRGMWRI